MNDKHDITHGFMWKIEPEGDWTKILPRKECSLKIEARGIFTGAEVIKGPNWCDGNIDGNDVGFVISLGSHSDTKFKSGTAKVLWKATEKTAVHRIGRYGCADIVYSRLT